MNVQQRGVSFGRVSGRKLGRSADWAARAWGSLGELLLPRSCSCCSVALPYGSGPALCDECLMRWKRACAKTERVDPMQDVPETVVASRYDGIVPRVVLGMKNAGRTDLVPLMGMPWPGVCSSCCGHIARILGGVLYSVPLSVRFF